MKILLLIAALYCAVQPLERKYNPGLSFSIHNELMVQSKLAYGTFLQRTLNNGAKFNVTVPCPMNTTADCGTLIDCMYTIGNLTYDMISVD